MISTESLCEKSSVGIASEQLVLDTDPFASPILIAVIESSVDDDSGNAAKDQGGVRKRRRHTGKAIKSSSRVAMPFIKTEPVDLAEAVVPGSSCSNPESLCCSAEIFAPTSPLHGSQGLPDLSSYFMGSYPPLHLPPRHQGVAVLTPPRQRREPNLRRVSRSLPTWWVAVRGQGCRSSGLP